MDLTNYFLPKIEHFHILGYWILLLIAMLESLAFVGILVPGTFFIILFGSLAANGYFSIVDLIWFAAAGAVLGDAASFYLGKRGTGFFSENNRIFKTGFLERGKDFFSRHGAKSVFLGRFVGPVRAVIPFIAGLSAMKTARFYFWDITSAILWATMHLLLGYFLGHAWRLVEVWSTRIGVFLAGVAIFVVCVYLFERFLLHKGKQLFSFLGSAVSSAARSVEEKPAVRRFVDNHPRLFAYLGNRVDSRHFTGLPLTLFAIAFFYILLVLMGVVEDILRSETIVTVDKNIENLLFVYRDPLLVKVFLWITVLGKLKIILAFTVALTLLFRLWNRIKLIAPLWITIGGSYLFILIGKEALRRPRPAGLAVYSESYFSFPSGHATIAMALIGFTVYFLWGETVTWKNRLNILFAAAMAILSIGFSRLYLGVHFLSDVLGGYLLGLLWLIIGICISELRLFQTAGQQPNPTGIPKAGLISSAILLAVAGFYVFSAYTFNPARFIPAEKHVTYVSGGKLERIFSVYGLPRYTESITGDRQEPLSLVITATDEGTLEKAFGKAGWRPTDPVTFLTVAKTVNAFIFNEDYPAAPISPSFWNNSVNETGFVKPVSKGSVRRRHEARIWKTKYVTEEGRKIYVGIATSEKVAGWRIFPRMGPHPDKDRELLFTDLARSGGIASYGRYRFVPPMSGWSFTDAPFFTDGFLYVINLK
jgi:membrane protein DedA with SNARE-associated domain/membrane-associated phospholipid phosphatase